tara:strand:- start:1241 stop:1471 length:231 start_codon:yes stop_codon:yes gene_type:complete
MNKVQSQMWAIFLADPKHLEGIIQRDNERSGLKLAVEVEPHGKGASFVTGTIQSVMFVIGAVANEGEDFLAKAQVR